jgi:pyruvate dehydrogenase E1 component alpha subunit
LEFATTRIRGHYEGDSQRYRKDKAPPVDPLLVARARLDERGTPTAEIEAIEADIRAEVLRAVEAARLSPNPTLESAAEEVYAPTEVTA